MYKKGTGMCTFIISTKRLLNLCKTLTFLFYFNKTMDAYIILQVNRSLNASEESSVHKNSSLLTQWS